MSICQAGHNPTPAETFTTARGVKLCTVCLGIPDDPREVARNKARKFGSGLTKWHRRKHGDELDGKLRASYRITQHDEGVPCPTCGHRTRFIVTKTAELGVTTWCANCYDRTPQPVTSRSPQPTTSRNW